MFLRLGYLSDSVETSITWNKCESCVENVRNVYAHNLKKLNVQGNVSFRYQSRLLSDFRLTHVKIHCL